ncbi:DUF5681 domain-containing protein [Ottowia testudinis]|uniref:DUF5681 domain-containing protein n=1 Tax=Ottowia testudinis TaxID=2816950 RepID=A0A975H4G6_9BURK|nr:DUF5681 domain-containing protein [Ottowia testudinis]QTD46350.1 hypothetical protein J1M35_05520 [Ottowia testudinis]
MSYEIGYRRPPKDSQFQKGKSGNPKGRPKGSKNFLTLLTKELDQKITVNENGRKKTITRQHAIVKRMVSGALSGDSKATLTLLDVLKRTGGLDASSGSEPSLGFDPAEVLAAYLARQGQSGN